MDVKNSEDLPKGYANGYIEGVRNASAIINRLIGHVDSDTLSEDRAFHEGLVQADNKIRSLIERRERAIKSSMTDEARKTRVAPMDSAHAACLLAAIEEDAAFGQLSPLATILGRVARSTVMQDYDVLCVVSMFLDEMSRQHVNDLPKEPS